MEYTIVFLVVLLGVAAVACVYIPLRILAARGSVGRGTLQEGAYFAALGLGYMAVEIGLLQRYGLFLGHPNYALSVVLATLLAATGIGSAANQRLVHWLGGLRPIAMWVAAFLVVEDLAAVPFLPRLAWLPLGVRMLIVVVLVAPLGAMLGVFFPRALDCLKGVASARAPWAWGVNGIFSVLGPVLAVALSMTWGIRALLMVAALIYLAAGHLRPENWPAASEERHPA